MVKDFDKNEMVEWEKKKTKTVNVEKLLQVFVI